jgi:predicted ferric reductase
MKEKIDWYVIKKCLWYVWLAIIIYLFFESVFLTPLIRWDWGFYNLKMLVTIGLCGITLMIIMWNRINKLEKRLKTKITGKDNET